MARFSFCSGLVSLDVPDEWGIIALGMTRGAVTSPGNPAIRLIFTAASYEYPEFVRRRDVSPVIREHTGYPEPEGPVAPGTVATWPGASQPVPFWKRLLSRQTSYRLQYFAIAGILEPNMIRVISGQLSIPAGRGDGASFEALFPNVSVMLEQAAFAPERALFDRVAGTSELQLINPGNGVFFRLPKQWRYETGEDNCCTAISGGPLDAQVRISAIDYEGDAETTAREIAEQLIDRFAEIPDDETERPAVEGSETDATASVWFADEEDVPPVRHFAAHRVIRRDGVTKIVYLVLSIPETRVVTEAGKACIALFRRELANAVVLSDIG